MALEAAGQLVGGLYVKIDPTILNSRNRGLWNARRRCELVLTRAYNSRMILTDSPTDSTTLFIGGRYSHLSRLAIIMCGDVNVLHQVI